MNTLTARLLATYLALIAICLGVIVWRVGAMLDASRFTGTQSDQEGRAILVASATEESLEKYLTGLIDFVELQDEAATHAAQISQHLVILDEHGVQIANPEGINEPPDQSIQPEIAQAIAGKVSNVIRYDPDDADDVLFTAAPIRHDKDIIGIVRIELPIGAVREASRRTWLTLTGGALLAAAGTILISLLFARTIVRPIRKIERAATALADGDLSRRLDISGPEELARLARAFNLMATRISHVMQDQRAFVANAAHELRTPLTTIRLRAEALHGGSPLAPEMTDQFLSDIENETQRLSRLVGELLDLSRLETGLVTTRRESISVERVAKAAVESVTPRAMEKSITLQVVAPAGLPSLVADPDQLRQVMLNLLDNALKFTPNGGRVELTESATQREVWVEVRDSGPGIAAEDLPHIFDRFYRGDKARARETGGTGLGLAIVKSIVEAHGGRVWASSAAGEGATVAFALPIQ